MLTGSLQTLCTTLLLHFARPASLHHQCTTLALRKVDCLFLLNLGHCRGCERVYLLKRKGFVKVALQAGTPIVPTYLLGQSQASAAW